MSPKVRRIILILFFIAVVATVAVYFLFDKNLKYTWYTASVAGIFYLIYRFSK